MTHKLTSQICFHNQVLLSLLVLYHQALKDLFVQKLFQALNLAE